MSIQSDYRPRLAAELRHPNPAHPSRVHSFGDLRSRHRPGHRRPTNAASGPGQPRGVLALRMSVFPAAAPGRDILLFTRGVVVAESETGDHLDIIPRRVYHHSSHGRVRDPVIPLDFKSPLEGKRPRCILPCWTVSILFFLRLRILMV